MRKAHDDDQATQLPPARTASVQPATASMNHPIVRRALELAKRYSDWTGLQVLDVAMNGHVETHPDFEFPPNDKGYDDWLSPPSPFAQLLKVAFAPKLAGDAFDARSEQWHDVIDAWRWRYRLSASHRKSASEDLGRPW